MWYGKNEFLNHGDKRRRGLATQQLTAPRSPGFMRKPGRVQ